MKRLLTSIAVLGLFGTSAFAEYRPPGQMASPSTVVRNPAKPRPVLRVCTGRVDGVYQAAAAYLAAAGQGAFQIQPVLTKGAMENAQMVTEGRCDAGFVQSDALRLYRDQDPRAESGIDRILSLYPEYAHLLCNRSANISKVTQLTNNNVVAIGSEGSGSNVTWKGFVKSYKDRYGAVKTSDKEGMLALIAAADGEEVTCALVVGGLNMGLLKNQAQKLADKLVLVNVSDGEFGNEKDAKGAPIYSYQSFPSGTYGKLMPSGMLFGHNDAKTIAVNAVFIANHEFLQNNPGLSDVLLTAVTNALPKIKERAAQ